MDDVLRVDAPTGTFNVSTGEGRTIHDVFLAVANYLGITPPDVPVVPPGQDDVSQVVLDPSAAHQAFGWTAKVNFEDTIANQLRWYDQYGINDIYSHLATPSTNKA